MEWLQYDVVRIVWGGFTGALMVDILAFRSWKSWNDAATYSWSVASLRWAQGAVGALVGWLGWTAATLVVGGGS